MKLFNDSLTSRLDTVERNIKSKSNSFYDSYLDLLEATIKFILDENSISYDDSRTCGYIVRGETVRQFFLSTLKLDEYIYKKLPDYIKKCNDHKHKKEKHLEISSVINFLIVFFNLVNSYLVYIKAVEIEFNADYYVSIFGENERLNNQYKEELFQLKEELKDAYLHQKLSEQDALQYQKLLTEKDFELMNLDDQNQKLQQQISALKDIKINSMEEKLNKTIDLLNNMQAYLVENRILARRTSMLIDGRDITDEDLKAEREKMETMVNHGK